jgi:hypothetical protein
MGSLPSMSRPNCLNRFFICYLALLCIFKSFIISFIFRLDPTFNGALSILNISSLSLSNYIYDNLGTTLLISPFRCTIRWFSFLRICFIIRKFRLKNTGYSFFLILFSSMKIVVENEFKTLIWSTS